MDPSGRIRRRTAPLSAVLVLVELEPLVDELVEVEELVELEVKVG